MSRKQEKTKKVKIMIVGCSSKRYPVEFEKNAHAIKSFRDDMMSKDSYSLERSNTRNSYVMHQSSSLMAKPSSLTDISPSHLPSPSSMKSFSDRTQPSTGRVLRPRSTQDTLSKFDSLYIIYI